MNSSRRMAALQARALAAQGYRACCRSTCTAAATAAATSRDARWDALEGRPGRRPALARRAHRRAGWPVGPAPGRPARARLRAPAPAQPLAGLVLWQPVHDGRRLHEPVPAPAPGQRHAGRRRRRQRGTAGTARRAGRRAKRWKSPATSCIRQLAAAHRRARRWRSWRRRPARCTGSKWRRRPARPLPPAAARVAALALRRARSHAPVDGPAVLGHARKSPNARRCWRPPGRRCGGRRCMLKNARSRFAAAATRLYGILSLPDAAGARAACWSSSAARSTGPAATASSPCWRARWPQHGIAGDALRLPRHGRQRGRPARLRRRRRRPARRDRRLLRAACPACAKWCCGACATAPRPPRCTPPATPRVRGLVLLNPWVRTDAGIAARHAETLLPQPPAASRRCGRRSLRGRFDLRGAAGARCWRWSASARQRRPTPARGARCRSACTTGWRASAARCWWSSAAPT